MTKYVILFKPAVVAEGDDPGGFVPSTGTFEAANEKGAIRAAAEKSGVPGSYVAVPERSWNVRDVTVVPAPHIKIS